ncbi:MAG: protein kinase [Planctomycetota bacterium]
MALAPKLDGYEFIELLGEGWFGQVWKAWDQTLQRHVAVKLLSREKYSSAAVDGLIEEARKMAELAKRDYLVKVFHAKKGITNCFVVMEYVDGGDLGSRTSAMDPMPWRQAVKYTLHAATGLAGLHKEGYVHRDIKPDNLLLDTKTDQGLLGDFGLAATVTAVPGRAGARAYLAPEVRNNAPHSVKSDVYSLSASLYHFVVGYPPGREPDPREALQRQGIPDPLQRAILSGLEPDPEYRNDLASLIGLLADCYWFPVRERLSTLPLYEKSKVGLRTSVHIADESTPTRFHPFNRDQLNSQIFKTGALVKIETVGNAEGHLTMLVLDSLDNLTIGFPQNGIGGNEIRAAQPHRFVFELTRPAGTTTFFVVWTREDVRLAPDQWRGWLEGSQEMELAEEKAIRTRGAKLLEHRVGRIPRKSYDYTEVRISHLS